MKKSIVTGALVLLMMCYAGYSRAQQATTLSQELKETSDRQRQVMKDSLQVTDAVITKVFAARDDYFEKARSIRGDQKLSDAEKEKQLADLRQKTDKAIKKHLGDATYEKYIQMISNRLKTKEGMTGFKPLAGS